MNQSMNNPPQIMNHAADVISAGAVVGAFAHILPPLAALIAVLWYCLEIFESKTVQGFIRGRRLRRHRQRRHLHKLIHHKAKPPPAS